MQKQGLYNILRQERFGNPHAKEPSVTQFTAWAFHVVGELPIAVEYLPLQEEELASATAMYCMHLGKCLALRYNKLCLTIGMLLTLTGTITGERVMEQILDSLNYPYRPWITERWGPV